MDHLSLLYNTFFHLVLAAVKGPGIGLCKDLGTLSLAGCMQGFIQLVEVPFPLVGGMTLKSISL